MKKTISLSLSNC